MTAPRGQAAASAPAATPAPAAPVLQDVVDTSAQHIIGISYPPAAAKYPALATELKRYADEARAVLTRAEAEPRKTPVDAPFELSLNFVLKAETPQVVAVAADGSRFTGGAHAEPLVARFVYLPQQNKVLTATDLFADAKATEAVARLVGQRLHEGLVARLDADKVVGSDRAQILSNTGKMIDEALKKDGALLAHFEPVMDGAGRVGALRFVFAPAQVAPYVDGTQSAEITAGELRPHVAETYRGLFADAAR